MKDFTDADRPAHMNYVCSRSVLHCWLHTVCQLHTIAVSTQALPVASPAITLTSWQWLFVDFSRPHPVLADLIRICTAARNRTKVIVSECFCSLPIFGPVRRVLDTLAWGNSTWKCDNWNVADYNNRTQLPFTVMIKLIDSTMANKPSFLSRCLVIFYIWSHSGFEPAENIQLANLDEAGCQICCTKVCVSQGNMSNLRSHLWTWQQ